MKRRILIADADEKFSTELMTALQTCDMFEVVGLATDGEQAIKMVQKKQPDILALDLLLPIFDGLTVLEQIRNTGFCPQFLITSTFISTYVIESAVRMGVQQFILKPCCADVVVKNLQQMVTGEKDDAVIPLRNGAGNVESLVTNILHDIGVPAHIKGYQFLREAIILAVTDEDNSNAILKNRYQEVANAFETTARKVESAIRHAIEVAWDRGDLDTLQGYLGYTVSNTKGKPTNSEFISIVADRIRLWRKNHSDAVE